MRTPTPSELALAEAAADRIVTTVPAAMCGPRDRLVRDMLPTMQRLEAQFERAERHAARKAGSSSQRKAA